jgi:hypothetical protein
MRIYGLTGVATVGKDLFVKLMIEMIPNTQRFALADNLKKDLQLFIQDRFGFDILHCLPEEKESVRDIMVAYGKSKRRMSNGKYWTNILEEQIKLSTASTIIITDIRYGTYPEDENWWIKEKMGGRLIHITRTDADGREILAPNFDETENDPIMKSSADVKIWWQTDLVSARETVRKFVESEGL